MDVIPIENNADYLNEHLNVFNLPNSRIGPLPAHPFLLALGEEVLKAHESSNNRGNKFIDVGFASDINSKRRDDQGGVSMSNLLKRSEEPIFKEALLSMTNLCHQVCQPEVKGKVFVDAHREAVCASTLVPGNRIEALRLALTNSSSHIVDIHLDGQNCTVDNFKGVINFSRWVLLSDGLWWRLSLIGYSRKSIAGFLRRRDLYMPLVERICSF